MKALNWGRDYKSLRVIENVVSTDVFITTKALA